MQIDKRRCMGNKETAMSKSKRSNRSSIAMALIVVVSAWLMSEYGMGAEPK